ncbi:MAG: ABC transporter permease subunit [Solirubrobacterales bacterium]|nr:ABC transporter permease subunit [Solirubrobacterales bacterium]MBV9800802.1 ABC transporter permease subunit [Solirubrobacterales bacterium]
MTRLLSSELLKLRTTRTFYALTGAAVALIVIIAVLAAALGKFKTTGTPGRDVLSVAGLAPLFALVIGVTGVTSEFRHGTITPSLLVEPVRTRLMAAKLAAQLIAGLALGAVCYAACAAIVSVLLSGRGIATGMSTSHWIGAVIGGAVASMLYAALGLGVGALLRNQVGAIVVVLAWVFVIENLLGIIPGGFGDAIKKYGLSGVGSSLARTASHASRIGQVPAGLLLLGYALLLVIAGTIIVRQRDVSS